MDTEDSAALTPGSGDTSPTESVEVRTDGPFRLVRRALVVGFVLILGFSALEPPNIVASVALDPSWQQVLCWAGAEGLQIGRDFVFTHGPLGWLIQPTYQAEIFGARVWGELVVKLLLSIALVIGAGSITERPRRAIFLALALLVLSKDCLFFTAALLVARDLCRGSTLPPWRLAFGILLLALLAQIKFTFFLFAGLAMVVTATSSWLEARSPRRAVAILAGFPVAFLFFWLLAGQSLAVLPEHVISGWEVSKGYVEAMSRADAPGRDAALAGVAFLLWGAAAALGLWRGPRPRPVWGPALLTLATSYLAWKYAFVRADAHHILNVYQFLAVIPLLSWPPRDSGRVDRRVRAGLLLAAMAPGAWGVYWNAIEHRVTTPGIVTRIPAAALRGVGYMATLGGQRTRLERLRSEEAARFLLPEARRIIGDAPVDILNVSHQGVVLLNGLHYAPRPVIQSFKAYTPYLLDRNLTYMRSAAAPEFLLLNFEGKDRRYPGQEDGPVLREVLRRYAPVGRDGPYEILQKVADPPDRAAAPDRLLLEKTLAWGEPLDLTAHGERLLVLYLEFDHTLAGRAQTTLLRAPAVLMEVAGPAGRLEFRVVPGMSRQGFLIQPLLTNHGALLTCYEPAADRPSRTRVDSITLRPWIAEQAGLFREEIRVRLFEMPYQAVARSSRKE